MPGEKEIGNKKVRFVLAQMKKVVFLQSEKLR